MDSLYKGVDPVVKLSELVNKLKALGIEKFFVHHPQITATMDSMEMSKFAASHPNQYVKILHQDLDTERHNTYLYLGIAHEAE